jgi:ABC-type bacteriocin/lantibiotic exporter with double-glycine peptidase domain
MIAAYYGKSCDPSKIKYISRISQKGSSMLDLVNAAGKMGLRCSGFEVSAL